MRITISAIALALVTFLAVRPAHALLGAVGWIGYGNVFQDESDENLGPTLEFGPSLGIPVVSLDLTYWTDLGDAGESSQLRLGGRVKPPVFPLYGRVAVGFPLHGDTRDVFGTDIILGAGAEVLSLAVLKVNLELDYHLWTEGPDVHPVELKAGVAIGF